MFVLEAPYPGSMTAVMLPNPELSDGEGLTDEVIPRRAIDGTLRTYVKTKGGRRKLSWDFRLTRPRALELRAFLRLYFAAQMKVTDHNDRKWIGNLVNNPFELTSTRGARPDTATTRGEIMSIRLEFEGIENA